MAASPARRAALWIATGVGVGRIPFAPGTFGSLLGVALAAGLARVGAPWSFVAALAILVPVGIRCATIAEQELGGHDPGPVVVDEIAGQLVALTLLPRTPAVWIAGFVLFRLFDIWKPWPVRRLEGLPGGSGIMADDLFAGLYANLALQAWIHLAPSGLALS